MKINIDTKKVVETSTNILQKTTDISKKTAGALKEGAKSISDKSKQDSYLRRMKKYNPLFWEQYKSEDYHIPNMIMIVDDAVRRGIDVCEGAIGWTNMEKDIEVLYLYDEAVEMSGIQFVPNVTCDAVYYVDSFARNRFIKLDCIFSKAHEERLAELKHIAYSLGAKFCSIEISESSKEIKVDKRKAEIKKGSLPGAAGEQSMAYQGGYQRDGRVEVKFEGSNIPKEPELKWFAHDDNIKRLIEMRCNNGNSIKAETLELSGTSSATMSQKTAYAIDGAISKMHIKGSSTMESQATKENMSKLIFYIEF